MLPTLLLCALIFLLPVFFNSLFSLLVLLRITDVVSHCVDIFEERSCWIL